MASCDPARQKHLRRIVRNFHQAVWDSVREKVVLSGFYAKCSHDKHWKKQLLDTVTFSLHGWFGDAVYTPVTLTFGMFNARLA